MTEREVLIVEDEEKLAAVVCDYLRQAGFAPHWLADGAAATQWVREHRPGIILLDLMLPGRDGTEICKEIRQFSSIPIIMVTARVEEIDRLLGFEFGADDYICKPFSPRELVARVKAVLRRAGQGQTRAPAGVTLDENRYLATVAGQALDLTAVEFRLLQILVASPGRIFGRQQLMDRIYQDQRIVSDRTIDSHIKKLRKKINAVLDGEEIIHSVYGVGYKYEQETASNHQSS
jgi:two-component system response regulator BaeR